MSFSYPPFSGFRVTTDEDAPGILFGWECDSCGATSGNVTPATVSVETLWDKYRSHLIASHKLTPPTPKCNATKDLVDVVSGIAMGKLVCRRDIRHSGEHAWEWVQS